MIYRNPEADTFGMGAPADAICGFDDHTGYTCLSQRAAGCHSGGTGPNDHNIGIRGYFVYTGTCGVVTYGDHGAVLWGRIAGFSAA
ncbi:hypothetical protein [Sulfitobacter sp. JL08]|uniref:hypothetical protein n=1 Tax=Sulfitobacter sp. JL08 TaxID=2070369 RepID=UPI0020C8032C|nr:hypothetical protein [Sulfitobacter sp. JL08]